MSYESHCVGQNNLSDVRHLNGSQRRIKSGEQLIGRIHFGIRQQIKESGLAGIGISDKGNHGNIVVNAGPAALGTAALHQIEISL